MQKRTRAGVFCLHNDRLLSIELQDPTTKKRSWSLPGGAVEDGETFESAAVRETLEETGYHVELTSDVFTCHYLFRWNAENYDCTTHWFSASLLSAAPEPVDDASYLLCNMWLGWPRSRPLFDNNPTYNEAFRHFLS